MQVILIWIDLIKEWVLSGKWWKVDNSSPKSLSKTQIITVIKKNGSYVSYVCVDL